MTTERPDVTVTNGYPIRKVATILGLHPNTVRNWVIGGVFKSNEMGMTKHGRKMIIIKGRGILRVWNENQG